MSVSLSSLSLSLTSACLKVDYARHYLPQLLPGEIGRVLYIEPYSVLQGMIISNHSVSSLSLSLSLSLYLFTVK